ncbi:MAG: translocation protein TolB [Bacteroidota bacterium]
MRKFNQIIFIFLILLAPAITYGQQTFDKFGRNRIQYEQFDWRFLSSDNFDFYYYRGSEKIAKESIEYLEKEFDRITDMIGFPPYSKTKIFLYNSISDLQQSNVGVNDGTFTPGGETQFVKSHIEVANPGNTAALKEELIHKVSELMVNEMLFGGNLKDMFQSGILLNLPEWFIKGASLYVAKGWSKEMDDFTRDLVNQKKAKKLNRLSGNDAALAGQSVWNYIAQKYGNSNISNILNYTRIIRNEEKSIGITLGITFEQLIYEWQNYYIDIDRQVDENYATPPKENRLIDQRNKKDLVYSNLKFSPDGTQLAYTANNNGRYSVVLRNIETGKEQDILKGGYKVINQEIDYNLPLIDWSDENTLGIIYSKRGKLIFTLYDVQNGSKLPRPLDKMEQVKSMDFSDNGRLLVVSASVKGNNDLYLLSTRRNRTRRLTDDLFDDTHASFVPGTNTIIFSSNRVTDTLKAKQGDIDLIKGNSNLFFYNLDTTKTVLSRVTNTISSDTKPLALNRDRIFYLSDQKGVTNIFSYSISTGIYTQVTNYSQSLQSYDIQFGNSQLAFISSERGKSHIYYDASFNYDQQIFTPITPRQQVIQAKEFRIRKNAQKSNGLTIKEVVEQRLADKKKEEEAKQDTTAQDDGVIDTDNYEFQTDEDEEEEDIINTDDYKFDTESAKKEEDSFLTQYRQLRKKSKISGPYPYETRFSADNLVTSFVIDPLRGFGILLQSEMTDMLENHKFFGGVMATTDLRSGDINVEYQYLKTLIDYNARFDRNVIFWENEQAVQQYSKNTFEIGASLPINTKTRFSIKPFYTITRFENLVPGAVNTPNPGPGLPFADIETDQFLGAKVEFVYDNSVINGLNIISGTRARVSLKHYEGIVDKDNSFTNLKVDFRHYQKIHREIVLATRVFYGSFFGRDPKQYLLGGMDNWLLRDENTNGDGNPLATGENDIRTNNSDLLFLEYATNLRGFDYAELFGNNALLFNAELRIPVVRYLQSGPISSNFFRNLQFTGFFDIGSAWTGVSPFNDDNTISEKVVPERQEDRDRTNFLVTLRNFRNPWLYSYGVGLRTMLLGYYVKFDLAWPVENFDVGPPALHITLGYDF